MNKTTLTAGALSALLIAGGLAGTLSAQSAAEATGITEAQAIELALTEIPGEVLETELETEDGVTIYEIEILSAEDEEFYVEIDAQSGEILLAEAESDDDDDDDDDDDCDKDDKDDKDKA